MYGIKVGKYLSMYEFRVGELIERLSEKYDKPVVILIDEYEKPVLDVIDDVELVRYNLDTLKAFYTVMKAEDAYIGFVLLTGVIKFSMSGEFSGFNNFIDIMRHSDYSSILGITEEELSDYFSNYIDELGKELKMSKGEVMEEIKRWYDGYCFSTKCQKVYNPFSLLLLFKNKEFFDYWFESRAPKFLIRLIKDKYFDVSMVEDLWVSEFLFSGVEVEGLDVIPLLFRTSYLTISDVQLYRHTMETRYKIGFPNLGAKNAFLNILLEKA